MSTRIRSASFRRKVMSAGDAAGFIKDGMTCAMSGFTPSGYPKAVPVALAKRIKDTGETCRLFIITGASVGEEIDGELGTLGAIARRTPYQTNDELRRKINSGATDFFDPHLGEMDGNVRRGFYGPVDVAVVEAVAITEDGHVIPSTSVGNAPSALQAARNVIIEVNEAQPADLEGMHDIFIPGDPPHKQPILVKDPADRIGTPYMEVPLDKVVAVVLTNKRDSPRSLAEPDEASEAISRHLIEFFTHETRKGRLPPTLLPLQSGVGNVANSVLKGFLESSFSGLSFYSEVIQDGAVDLIDAGKFRVASGTALSLSPERLDQFLAEIRKYRQTIILRPQEISNCPEVISRIGVIAINTAVEADIYGNVNSSHITGFRLINGIGGSGDFARSAYLCIFSTPSIKGGGAISPVVPLVSHVDHTEHDVDVLVTDQGLADLRGLGPSQRARTIINNCVHPFFRDAMTEYWSCAQKSGGHIPVDLARALSWHVNFLRTKRMT